MISDELMSKLLSVNHQWEYVNPERAAQWLNTLHPQQRRQRQSVIATYARQMGAGDWGISPDPIVFDETGRLVNGQHRLQALINANCTVMFLVFRQWPVSTRDNVCIIDSGLRRSAGDVVYMAGGTPPNAQVDAILAMMATMHVNHTGQIAAADLLAWRQAWGEGAEWTARFKCDASRYVMNASTGAAIASAYYHVDHDRLAHFAHVLMTGLSESADDVMAVTLRNTLIARAVSRGARITRERIYHLTETAIYNHLRGHRGRLVPRENIIYPVHQLLPGHKSRDREIPLDEQAEPC